MKKTCLQYGKKIIKSKVIQKKLFNIEDERNQCFSGIKRFVSTLRMGGMIGPMYSVKSSPKATGK